MKTFILLFCTTVFGITSENIFSQETISIEADIEITVDEVFDIIQKQTKYRFMYSQNLFENTPKVKLKKGTISLNNLLKQSLAETNVNFKLSEDNMIVVREQKRVIPLKEETFSNQQPEITGTVSDSEGQPLPGASIVEKGTTNGVQSDFDGNFSIALGDENAVLVFSYIGYANQEIIVANQTELNVIMTVDAAGLDEVVVIGYGSVKKSDLTGAVTSLSSDDLTDNVAVNVTQQLQGRAAGVNIFQNSTAPGGGSTIQIRGIGSINAGNAPLFVVDGLPISNGDAVNGGDLNAIPANPLNTINPNDIKSIEILKDASATAIYGSRGANGVILITTKSGGEGKLKISYSGRTSAFSLVDTPDILNAQQYQTNLNQLLDAGATNATEAERVVDVANGGLGTDWQDQLFRSAISQEHNISFSGGNDKSTYFSSVGYFNQEGTVNRSKLERFSLRTNLASQTDKFKFGLNSTVTYTLEDIVAAAAGINNEAGPINSAFYYDPTAPIFANEETNEFFFSPFLNIENPVALLEGRTVDNSTFRLISSAFGEYSITPALSARVNLGFDFQTARRDIFLNDFTQTGAALGGQGQVFTGNNFNYLAEATLNYNKEFNNGDVLSLLGGISTQKFFINSSNSTAQGFLSLATGTDNLQSGDPLLNTVATSDVENTLLSYIGRANYSIKDKYLLTATLRVDGSSRFGENNKYGYFPSGAFAWKLDNEEFLRDSKVFDQLKLRASYGQTGNQAIGNFNSLTTIRSGGTVIIPGGNQVLAAQPSRIANPDLKWETTTQFDVGLDFSIVGGRLSGTVDYYNRRTEDLLFNVPIPAQTGFATVLTNIGSVENKGFEFLIDSRNLVGDFTWNTSLNFSTLKNEVLDIGDADEIVNGEGILRPGETINSYFGHEILGIWQVDDDFTNAPVGTSPGDFKYNDIDGDGDITADDRTILGSSVPSFSWGMTNTFSYKGISLTANLIGVHGAQLYNQNLAFTFLPTNFRRNRLAEPIINRWTPENPTNEYPSFLNNTLEGSNLVTSSTIEDAGYVRLQTLTLGYTLPLPESSAFRNIKVSLTGENLALWTNYSGVDPGLSIVAGNTGIRRDFIAYPQSRIFSLNLTVDF